MSYRIGIITIVITSFDISLRKMDFPRMQCRRSGLVPPIAWSYTRDFFVALSVRRWCSKVPCSGLGGVEAMTMYDSNEWGFRFLGPGSDGLGSQQIRV